jgi:hypothetical protein
MEQPYQMLAGESKRHEKLLPNCEKPGNPLMNRDTDIKIFNVCVKFVLLYGC